MKWRTLIDHASEMEYNGIAYSVKRLTRMGSISLGKLANFVVMDRDFMHDDFADIEKAVCLATIVDGEVVYKAD